MVFDDTAVMTQLLAAIKAAWPDVVKIHTEPPLVPGTINDLPRAFCIVRSVRLARSTGGATSKETQQNWTYDITRQAAYPQAGTLHAAKLQQTTSLVNQLTATTRFLGWKRDITNVDFGDTETEQGQSPVYTITLSFSVYVLAGA